MMKLILFSLEQCSPWLAKSWFRVENYLDIWNDKKDPDQRNLNPVIAVPNAIKNI